MLTEAKVREIQEQWTNQEIGVSEIFDEDRDDIIALAETCLAETARANKAEEAMAAAYAKMERSYDPSMRRFVAMAERKEQGDVPNDTDKSTG